MNYNSDEYLVSEISRGNIRAFNKLYKKYSSPIYNYIYRLIGVVSITEDIFQDTFTRVFQNINRFNPEYKFSTWIYTIASNLCFNELKKIKKNRSLFYSTELNHIKYQDKQQTEISGKEKSPLEQTETNDLKEKINNALSNLSENHRMVFVQKFYHNLSYKEIADIMNCSLGTVKSRIHYAIENLKKILED